jgi:DNA-binding LacI/PurR family transcriptional regulator
MRIDIARLGEDAFTMLLDRMADDAAPDTRIVQPQLVVRGSTGRRR